MMPEYEVFVSGRPRKIELMRTGGNNFSGKIDGKPWSLQLGSNGIDLGKPLTAKIDNKDHHVELAGIGLAKQYLLKVNEASFKVEVKIPARKTGMPAFEPIVTDSIRKVVANKVALEGTVSAPMTGKVVTVNVKKGDIVKAGQVLCVVEAMKMENEIAARKPGTVKEVYVSEGLPISEGEPLFVIG